MQTGSGAFLAVDAGEDQVSELGILRSRHARPHWLNTVYCTPAKPGSSAGTFVDIAGEATQHAVFIDERVPIGVRPWVQPRAGRADIPTILVAGG